jgi:hypothetical protein
VLFRSARSGSFNLFRQAADGTGEVERFTESLNTQLSGAFFPDGTRLVFREETEPVPTKNSVRASELVSCRSERRGAGLVRT